MQNTTVGQGEFRWDRDAGQFVGTITVHSYEHAIVAVPQEDKAGRSWRVTVFEGRPYGAYRVPLIDGDL